MCATQTSSLWVTWWLACKFSFKKGKKKVNLLIFITAKIGLKKLLAMSRSLVLLLILILRITVFTKCYLLQESLYPQSVTFCVCAPIAACSGRWCTWYGHAAPKAFPTWTAAGRVQLLFRWAALCITPFPTHPVAWARSGRVSQQGMKMERFL